LNPAVTSNRTTGLSTSGCLAPETASIPTSIIRIWSVQAFLFLHCDFISSGQAEHQAYRSRNSEELNRPNQADGSDSGSESETTESGTESEKTESEEMKIAEDSADEESEGDSENEESGSDSEDEDKEGEESKGAEKRMRSESESESESEREKSRKEQRITPSEFEKPRSHSPPWLDWTDSEAGLLPVEGTQLPLDFVQEDLAVPGNPPNTLSQGEMSNFKNTVRIAQIRPFQKPS
jgi:hypothetical protein